MFSGECAPTLAPWKPANEVTTSESISHQNDVDNHGIYDINDIVHFEDNDLVMRDPKNKHDHNKLDNSVDSFNIFNNIKKIHYNDKSTDLSGMNDVDTEMKSVDLKPMQMDADGKCECQHGGGCVGRVCLCPLGYAGAKCEITLDLKVSTFIRAYS